MGGVYHHVSAPMEARVRANIFVQVENSVWARVQVGVQADLLKTTTGVGAYEQAPWFVWYQFWDEYLAPNDLHALAHFNELVSGRWLGKESALLVRRPSILSRDADGRLHSETGKCLEYRDGWGFHAWHGVYVPGRAEPRQMSPAPLTQYHHIAWHAGQASGSF